MAEELLSRVKKRLDDVEVSDETIQSIIDDATQEVYADTNQTALNSQLETVVVGSSVIAINRIGTEGISSEGYSGVSTSYLDDLPPRLLSILNANRRLGSWGDDDESTT